MIRIGITGPESTGKSTLSTSLQKQFNCSLIKEFARGYLEERAGKYNQADLDVIAQNQYDLMHQSTAKNDLIICDTELTVLKIWSEFKYQSCSNLINRLLTAQQINFYFLCDIDLPWEEDPLREHPTQRQELFELYEEVLIQRNVPYCILSGNETERMQKATQIIHEVIIQINIK